MAIKLVVFDIAGTTVEDSNNVYEALKKGFSTFGFIITPEDADRVMGISKPVAIRTLLEEKFKMKESIGETVSKVHKAFKESMIEFYRNDPSVRAKKNAEATFRALKEKGILVGIDTGFSRDIADTIFERLGWKEANLIDYSVTNDEVNNGKPYPDMILKAIAELKIASVEEVAKVGDTPSDMQEGIAAGCKYVIGIATGAFTREALMLEEPTHLVDDLIEVVDIVTACD